MVLGLCSGIKYLFRKNLCSSFSGKAKPLIMLPSISNSSPIPMWSQGVSMVELAMAHVPAM